MACKYLDKICAVCGKKQEVLVFDNAQQQVNLENYKNYLQFNLEVCNNCAFVSEDISADSLSYNSVKNNSNYISASGYSFLDQQSKTFAKKWLQAYPANIFECYAIIKINCFDFDGAIKSYFRSAQMLVAIKNSLNNEKLEDLEDLKENQIDLYNNLDAKISNKIQDILQKIVELKNNPIKNLYTKIIIVESLIGLNKLEQAIEILNTLKLPQDIIDYITR